MKRTLIPCLTVLLCLLMKFNSAHAQLNAVHNLNVANATGTWLKIGTLTLPQQGQTVYMKFYGGSGYNSLVTQNGYAELMIRTGNGSSVNPQGFAFTAISTRYGYMQNFVTAIRIVPNAAGVSATAYDVYIAVGAYIGNSFYSIMGGPSAVWAPAVSMTTPPAGFDVPFDFRTHNDSYLANSLFVSMSTGNVGIGTITPGTKLAVNGDITSQKVKVTQTGWPDYVFEENYPLMTLPEMEAHIKQHKHLPGIPSAKDVTEKGLDLGQTQAALLQKIEELTLHLIEQNKRLDAQQRLLEQQAQQIKNLQKQ